MFSVNDVSPQKTSGYSRQNANLNKKIHFPKTLCLPVNILGLEADLMIKSTMRLLAPYNP
jgi:hypothetical protein